MQNTDKTSNKVHRVEQKQLFYGLSAHLGLPVCALVWKAIAIASNWRHFMLLLCDMTGVSLCLHRSLLFKKTKKKTRVTGTVIGTVYHVQMVFDHAFKWTARELSKSVQPLRLIKVGSGKLLASQHQNEKHYKLRWFISIQCKFVNL